MVQFEMAAIYSTGLDKTDGNEVLPGRESGQKGLSQKQAQACRQRQGMPPREAPRGPCSVLPLPSFGAWLVSLAAIYGGLTMWVVTLANVSWRACHVPDMVHAGSIALMKRLREAPCSRSHSKLVVMVKSRLSLAGEPQFTSYGLHFLISEMGMTSSSLAHRCLERLERPTNGFGNGPGLGSPRVRQAHLGPRGPAVLGASSFMRPGEASLTPRLARGMQGLGSPSHQLSDSPASLSGFSPCPSGSNPDLIKSWEGLIHRSKSLIRGTKSA